jgi:hypothetical protein
MENFMTPSEFKAWFDGFTEAFNGCPTKAQWSRIKERVAEINGKPITERVYVDRYWPPYYQKYPYWGVGHAICGTVAQNISNNMAGISQSAVGVASFDSHSAMVDLGRADAKALAA